LSYAPDHPALTSRAAANIDQILKGAKSRRPARGAGAKYELTIDLKTAKALDGTIPPLLLAAPTRQSNN